MVKFTALSFRWTRYDIPVNENLTFGKMAYNVQWINDFFFFAAAILICKHWFNFQSYFKINLTLTYICIIFRLEAYIALKRKG